MSKPLKKLFEVNDEIGCFKILKMSLEPIKKGENWYEEWFADIECQVCKTKYNRNQKHLNPSKNCTKCKTGRPRKSESNAPKINDVPKEVYELAFKEAWVK